MMKFVSIILVSCVLSSAWCYDDSSEERIEKILTKEKIEQLEDGLIKAKNTISRLEAIVAINPATDNRTEQLQEAKKQNMELQEKVNLYMGERDSLTKANEEKDQEICSLKLQLEIKNDKFEAAEMQKNECLLEREIRNGNLTAEKLSSSSFYQRFSYNLENAQKHLEIYQIRKNFNIIDLATAPSDHSDEPTLNVTDEYLAARDYFDTLSTDVFDKWGPIVSNGRQKYFYTSKSKQLNWDEAENFCEKLGMNLATFDSYDEALYFDGATTGSTWVGIRDKNKNGEFLRVTDGKNIKNIIPWRKGEPSGNEYCVHAHENRAYNDAECQASLRFGCELYDPQTHEESQEQIKSFKSAYAKLLQENFHRFETTSGGRKKTYFVSNFGNNLAWPEAFRYCQDIKMKLATFDAKLDAEFFKQIGFYNMWVGIRDNFNNGTFVGINDGNDFTRCLPWGEGEPSGNQFCVHLSSEHKYKDYYCSQKFSFVCETFESF